MQYLSPNVVDGILLSSRSVVGESDRIVEFVDREDDVVAETTGSKQQ
jgi:hypothetical protein